MEELNNLDAAAEGPALKNDGNTFAPTFWPLILDFILRLLLLELRAYKFVGEAWFWIGHISVALFLLIIFSLKDEKLKERHKLVITYIEDTVWSTIFLLLLVVSGAYITFSLYADWPFWLRTVLAIAALFSYGMYAVVIHVLSPKDITVAQRKKQRETLDDPNQNPIDANDIRIARMETEVASISIRIEAFTLESALFGALAFSGFLTLIASDQPMMQNIKYFLKNLRNIAAEARKFDLNSVRDMVDLISTSDYLMGAIAIQTLICSMLFVAVIISRVRFHEILKKVDYAIRVARMYNTKEEEVYKIKLESTTRNEAVEKRLKSLTKEVADAINEATPRFKDLMFITGFIKIIRTLGIFTFILILLTSSFLISKALAFLFMLILFAAAIYAFFEKWVRNNRLKENNFFLALEKKIFGIKND